MVERGVGRGVVGGSLRAAATDVRKVAAKDWQRGEATGFRRAAAAAKQKEVEMAEAAEEGSDWVVVSLWRGRVCGR